MRKRVIWPEFDVVAGVKQYDSGSLDGLLEQVNGIVATMAPGWPEDLQKRVQTLIDKEFEELRGHASLAEMQEAADHLLEVIVGLDLALMKGQGRSELEGKYYGFN